jgi:UDP-glucose 4-epimerase
MIYCGAVKLLVTGGAGYIGSIVARQLLGAGHEVVVLDNLFRGHREAIPDGARLLEVDLCDAAAVRDAVAEGFDGALHFAALALVAESVAHPERYYRTNVAGTLNLLDALRAAEVTRLVFSSTCAVYGEPEVVPMDEQTPTQPVNAYGASKLAVDRMIGDECRAHALGAVSLRYFNVAGASGELGEDHEPETHLIPNVLRAAQGIRPFVEVFGTDYPTPDGTAIRDYIHIEDLAAAHLLALDATHGGEHRIFNLGNGSGFSVREVIEAARAVTGEQIPVREAPRRPGDPPMLVAASAKIRDELGWERSRTWSPTRGRSPRRVPAATPAPPAAPPDAARARARARAPAHARPQIGKNPESARARRARSGERFARGEEQRCQQQGGPRSPSWSRSEPSWSAAAEGGARGRSS